MNFTVSDLTGHEYASLARLIKGDPAKALDDPDSLKFADCIAGLVLALKRRNGGDASYEALRDWTIADLMAELGLDGDSPAGIDHAATQEAVDQVTGTDGELGPTTARP